MSAAQLTTAISGTAAQQLYRTAICVASSEVTPAVQLALESQKKNSMPKASSKRICRASQRAAAVKRPVLTLLWTTASKDLGDLSPTLLQEIDRIKIQDR